MNHPKDTPAAVRVRQQRYRDRQAKDGLVQVQVFVPTAQVEKIREIAVQMQDNPHLQFAPIQKIGD
ncbi:hypothetical protein SAMN02745130_02152 [Thiothrix eikelboomii]|uniref:Uncharacterized protein n=1 Tax=Thiothrix eikelboomii TaxID=92487 RepID=A0A1T4WV67_9GAMM|nr:hypothetical protein [Thiothrix eikelboomii]SKA81007.1 hypothetical protein SAMN02745130_02152 [Thiothrix eikelboomii]